MEITTISNEKEKLIYQFINHALKSNPLESFTDIINKGNVQFNDWVCVQPKSQHFRRNYLGYLGRIVQIRCKSGLFLTRALDHQLYCWEDRSFIVVNDSIESLLKIGFPKLYTLDNEAREYKVVDNVGKVTRNEGFYCD